MLDRIEVFRGIASKNGIDIDLSVPLNTSTDEEMQKDRELIADFMSHTGETQRLLQQCEISNTQMRNIANKQIHENMSANQESK